MPSIWRKINNGEYEKYFVLIESLLEIVERVLPEEFLESITGEKFYVTQSGSLFSQI